MEPSKKLCLAKTITGVCTGVCLAALTAVPLISAATMEAGAANAFQNSDFIETEQPELSEETKKLISLYQKAPTEENYQNLRDMVIKNYNAVLERKEAKLAELKAETVGKPGGEAKVAEMEEIVQEMYLTYWDRIDSSMLRFADNRLLKWKISDAASYEYIPVMGAGESIYVKRTPVTNKEYAAFVRATGAQPPSNWTNGQYPEGEDDYPVNFVSYAEAEAYCAWLTEQDSVNTYRLPSESEWELAAGHMPKDADFNCGINDGRTPVGEFEGVTRGAHGAIDFWGNVWEWTSTVRSDTECTATLGVKGGSWFSDRTECRTEHRKEGRDAALGYEDVGFRVIQVLNGKEPGEGIEGTAPGTPVVSTTQISALPAASMEKINVSGLKCWLYAPKDAAEGMPLIVYLHGATGKGNDLDTLLEAEGFTQWLAEGTLGDVPAYVLIPQLPSDKKDWLAIKKDVVSAIQETVEACQADSSNVSLTGFSMGGAGTWNVAVSYPELFRCIAPCSGGVRANKAALSALGDMKIWTFVGTEDTVVKPQSAINFIEQLARSNSRASITEFEGAAHTDVPALVYLSDEIDLIRWLTEK